MIGAKTTVQNMTQRVEAAAQRASEGNVRAGAFLVQQDARASIVNAPVAQDTFTQAKVKRNAKGQYVKGSGRRKRKRGQRIPSTPGTPPHTRSGQMRRAIGYAANGDSAVIGTQ